MLPLFPTFVFSSTKNSHQSCLLLLFRISLLNTPLCSLQRNAPLTPPSASLRKNHILAADLLTQKHPIHEQPLPQPTLENRRGARRFSANAFHKPTQMMRDPHFNSNPLCEACRAALLVTYIALNFATICCKITTCPAPVSQNITAFLLSERVQETPIQPISIHRKFSRKWVHPMLMVLKAISPSPRGDRYVRCQEPQRT